MFYRHPSKAEKANPFELLITQLEEFGSANDAADRGYSDVAESSLTDG